MNNQLKHITTMEKKYRLLENDTVLVDDRKLYRIIALRDFADVETGDKGGYVESENNLSQSCDSWVYGDAKVYDDAVVCDDAEVCGYAEVYGDAVVRGKAGVYGDAVVRGNAKVYGDANVYGDAVVHGNAKVYGDAEVCRNAEVYGDAKVYGDAVICGDAEISDKAGYYVSKNIWSSGRYITFTRSNKMWRVGCFHGTGEELIRKAYQDSKVSGREYERIVRYVEEMYNDLKKDRRKNKKL